MGFVISNGDGEDLLELDRFAVAFVAAAGSTVARQVEGASGFPRGMCSWSCYAGGELLRENGLGEWSLWNAAARDGSSRHDWLVRDGMFMDLTAAQFVGYAEHIVGRGTNPLGARFPNLILTKSTSSIVEHPPIARWKDIIANLMGLAQFRARTPAIGGPGEHVRDQEVITREVPGLREQVDQPLRSSE